MRPFDFAAMGSTKTSAGGQGSPEITGGDSRTLKKPSENFGWGSSGGTEAGGFGDYKPMEDEEKGFFNHRLALFRSHSKGKIASGTTSRDQKNPLKGGPEGEEGEGKKVSTPRCRLAAPKKEIKGEA